MGTPKYKTKERLERSTSLDYMSVHTSEESFKKVFTQMKEEAAHASMLPLNVIRESRFSENHPDVIPVIIALDVTGSMGSIPKHFLTDGLPQLFSYLLDVTHKDIALCFMAIGDHIYDRYPLQVGQFESGDVEVDLWLTRIYIESGGGSGIRESYPLAWYFAANQVVTDYWEKNHKKGYLFTIGDEMSNHLSARFLSSCVNSQETQSYTDKEILEKAKEKWHVYHFNLTQTYAGHLPEVKDYWAKLMQQSAINVDNYRKLPELIGKIISEEVSFEVIPEASPAPEPPHITL